MDEQNLTKKQRKELKRQAKLVFADKQQKSQALRRFLIWGGVFIVIAFIVWGLVRSGSKGPSTLNSDPVAGLLPVSGNDWVRGNAMASTTLIEYSDLQCPACAQAEPFLKQVLDKYGSLARVIYRHYPLPLHLHGLEAARAAEAAGAQGRFWEMHDLLFARQTAWSVAPEILPLFQTYASELKLDLAKFNADYNSDAVKQKIQAMVDSGNAAGVNSTPSFFLNGRKLELTNFNDIVDAVAEAVK